jgi:hypothetical protein
MVPEEVTIVISIIGIKINIISPLKLSYNYTPFSYWSQAGRALTQNWDSGILTKWNIGLGF